MKRTAMAARGRAAIAGLLVALGCDADAALAPPSCDPPEIVGASIGPNAHNVLSAIVGVSARHATAAAAAFVDIGEGTEYLTPERALT